jgi:hypothetical protein
MNETVVIIVPGLGEKPSDNEGFAPRLARDVCGVEGFKGVETRYHAFPLSRRFCLSRVVEQVAADTEYFLKRDFNVRMVGFSNGAEVICRALREIDWPDDRQVNRVALFAAACESSFNANGLNRALLMHRVCQVVVGVSKADTVLSRWARLSKLLFSWMGLGYGALGYIGPRDVWPGIERSVVTVHRKYSHSDWTGSREVFDAATSVKRTFVPVHGDTQRIVLEPEEKGNEAQFI